MTAAALDRGADVDARGLCALRAFQLGALYAVGKASLLLGEATEEGAVRVDKGVHAVGNVAKHTAKEHLIRLVGKAR